jgi:hypothetical protein
MFRGDRPKTRRAARRRLFAACVLALISLRAEIIDRIAVSVTNQAITTSDVIREIRVISFLDHRKPDLSSESRRATADRMVEQRLILRELENSRYPVPDSSEIDPLLEQFKKGTFPSDAEYRRALAEGGVTEEDVRNELLWQRRLLLFLDVRFRPGVQVSAQDIQDYFVKAVEPAARAAKPDTPVNLEDYRSQIQEKLEGDQVDRQMNAWLESTRRRAEIVYHPEAFQ